MLCLRNVTFSTRAKGSPRHIRGALVHIHRHYFTRPIQLQDRPRDFMAVGLPLKDCGSSRPRSAGVSCEVLSLADDPDRSFGLVTPFPYIATPVHVERASYATIFEETLVCVGSVRTNSYQLSLDSRDRLRWGTLQSSPGTSP